MKIYSYLLSFVFLFIGTHIAKEKLSLKTFAEEAMAKDLIGNDPIIVANPYSAKIYSKLDLKHPAWNKLKRDELIIIPRNAALVEKLWGKQAQENGVIIFKAAQDSNYDVKKVTYVFNGKEISKTVADTITMNKVTTLIVVKDRQSEERVAFIQTIPQEKYLSELFRN